MSRRMFSDEITSTDAFLDLPKGSQLLYFHLGMSADDDGFVANPKMIMRVIGSSEDELKVLFAKKFLLAFDNGVCVVKHWRINNYIRKDIYKETKYINEKNSLFIRENGSYSFNPDGALPLPKGHFTVKDTDFVDVTSTSRALSIGKVSIDKNREDKKESSIYFLKEIPEETITEFIEKFKVEKSNIITKANALYDYCEAKGKRYKNYKSFLANALRKDFGERPPRKKKPIYEIVNGTAKVIGYE